MGVCVGLCLCLHLHVCLSTHYTDVMYVDRYMVSMYVIKAKLLM